MSELEIVDRLQVIRLNSGSIVDDAVRRYRADPNVLYAEPDYLVEAFDIIPNDPQFPTQWNLHNSGQNGGTPGADIHATQAWSLTAGASNVIVAVLDTGIDYTHPDLIAQVWNAAVPFAASGDNGVVLNCPAGSHGLNAVDNNCDPMDDNNHGTHVSGIIGATGNNGVGVSGVNWNVTILPCKFLDASGSGDLGSAIACLNLIKSLKDSGVNIIATNNSWGGFDYSQALQDAIAAQLADGLLFIAAAGNNSSDNDLNPVYPANIALPNIISVAATDRNDNLVSFSDDGRRTVHIGAPGDEILSTTPNNTYSVFSGTSMAAPHVSGVAALLKAQDSTRDWRAIKNLILAGGDANSSLGSTISQKRLSAYGSLACSNSLLQSRLLPVPDLISGSAPTTITLSMLNINCAQPAGPVAVQVSPGGQIIPLTDDGSGQDQVAGDGIYTGQWAPQGSGGYTLSFPDGSAVNVEVLENYGYAKVAASYQTITGTNLNLGDDSIAAITSPFPVQFGGGSFSQLFISSNGAISLTDAFSDYNNWSLVPDGFPSYVQRPNTLVAPFWMDLYPVKGTDQNVFWEVTGNSPNRQLVVEWRNVRSFLCRSDASATVTFEVVFKEGSSDVQFNYANTIFGGDCSQQDYGLTSTIGIQPSPTTGVVWSYDGQTWTAGGSSILWQSPPPIASSSPVPTLVSMSPMSAPLASPALTLTINGTGFVPSSSVQLDGINLPTTFVSSTQLTAVLPAELLNFNFRYPVGSRAEVTVYNASPGGGSSNVLVFTFIGPGAPYLASISPATATAGEFDFALNVQGNNLAVATIYWNGQPLQTFDLDNNNASAIVPSTLIVTPGTASVTAVSPSPNGGTSNAITFTINAPTPSQLLSYSGASQANDMNSRTTTVRAQRFLGWKYGQKLGPAYAKRFSRPYGTARPMTASASNGITGVASTTVRNSSISLAQPQSLPGFVFHPDLPASYLPTSVASGDFNGDGKTDWVVSNGGSNDLWVYLGNGDGTAQLPTIIQLAGASPLQVVATDLRNIGVLDLVVAEADSQTIGVLLGKGDGTFQPEVEYFVPAPPLSLTAADFNQDGHTDIAVGLAGDSATGPIATFLGDGNGGFIALLTSESDLGEVNFVTTSIISSDLNRDGYPDLLVVDEGGFVAGAHSYLNRGDGTFKHADFFYGTVTDMVTDVGVGDMDEDGCPDALTTDIFGTVTVFKGTCDGNFEGFPTAVVVGGGDVAAKMLVGDIDGDGHLDVITGGAYFGVGGAFGAEASNLVTVLKGDGKGNLGVPKVYRGEPSMYGLALADLNGDHIPDVIAASQDTDTAAVFINDGTGALAAPQGEYIGYFQGGTSNAPHTDFFVQDIDGDGKSDLALIELPEYTGDPWNLAVMLGDGQGHFGPAIRSPIGDTNNGIPGFVLGDFRNTGRPDLVAYEYDGISESNPVLIFLPNTGGGQFGVPRRTVLNLQNFGQPGIVATGDFNKDGKLDFVAASSVISAGLNGSSAGMTLTVFLGNGDGTFQQQATQTFDFPAPAVGLRPASVYVGDFNKDGNLDVLVWVYDNIDGALNHNVYEFLGNGNGTFQAAKLVLPNFGFFTVADLNHDDLPDIVEYAEPLTTSGAGTPVGISVYLGQPDGSFVLNQTYQPYNDIFTNEYLFDNGQPQQSFSPMVADFNGDGNLDIAVFQFQQQYPQGNSYLQILTGNGDGTFTPTYNATSFHKGTVPTTAADVTGDGRADLIEVDGWPSSFNVIPGAAGAAVQMALQASPIVGTQGTLILNASLLSASPTTVQLSASDPNISIPATATIPAGTLSTSVPFTLGSKYDSSKVFALTAQLGTQSTTIYSFETTSALAGFSLAVKFVPRTTFPDTPVPDSSVILTSYGGYSSTIQLACQGLPVEVTCQFEPANVSLPVSQPAISVLHMQVGAGVPSGAYPFSVIASDGNVTQVQNLTLYVGTLTNTTLNSSLNPSNVGQSVTFTATVTSSMQTPTGTVVFLDTATQIGVVQLNSSAQAAMTIATLAQGSHSITALYLGNASFATSDSTVLTQTVNAGPDFSLAVSPASKSVSPGQSTSYTVTLTPIGGFNQTIAISCGGAPANASCIPMSSSVTLNGSSAVQVQINVTTNANSLVTQWITMRFPGSTPGLIGLSVALCFLQFWSAFHRRLRRGYLVLCVFTILAAVCVVGCGSGGGSISGSSSAVTQSGDYTLTVMGSAGSGATSQTHSVVVTLIVN